MKDFFVHRTARGLILPFVIVICVLLAASAPARAGKSAFVEVGFLGDPPKDLTTGVPLFQNVFLNVVSVRINTNPTASGGGGKWQTIPVPPGIGGSGGIAELQIDLNDSQNVPQFFNTASVKLGNYMVAELELDPNNPGTLVSRCPGSPPVNTADGCINYPIQLANTSIISTPISGVAPQASQLAPLVLQLSMMINQSPTKPGGAYTVTVGIAPVTSMPVQGTITGSVSGAGNKKKKKVRNLTVTAEAIGTNTAITTAVFQSASGCKSKTQGCFTLTLPAAANFGTYYDIAVAGGANTYAAQRLLPLLPGQSLPSSPTDTSLEFTVTGNRPLGSITGTIKDGCTSKAIVGATLELLIPPNSNPTADCLHVATVGQCVAVATANTDNAGNFPMPGMISTPAEFQNVPQNVATMTVKNPPYAMEITAPGYEPLIVQALPSGSGGKNSGGTCAPVTSTTFGACNLSLMKGYITGNIPIVPPLPGQTTLVQVFAEDHDTNNIESALPMPVSIRNSNNPTVNVTYTLNVPLSVPAASNNAFDLFASTIDLYQGATDPYQGHNIVAISHVPAPAACATVTAPTPSNADTSDTSRVIGCVGHGSIFGPVANPNLGTSVVLEKLDPTGPADDNAVQITNSLVQNQPPLATSTNTYSFCAPADTYQVEEVQLPMPDPLSTPTSAPSPALVVGSEVMVTIPPPPVAGGNPTPTPAIKCPTTCSNPNGTCPGICNSKSQPISAP